MAATAFLFPGQGAQFVGMARSVVERCAAGRRLFDIAREILGYDLLDVCVNGPAERLDTTAVSQPALYVSSLAALEMLREESPAVVADCRLAAGLSLGEYTALTLAGVFQFEDGLRVVRARGEAMQAAADRNPSGMVSALMLNREQVDQVCAGAQSAGRLWVANYLCPGNTVLSGEKPACAAAVGLIEQAGGKPIPLTVAGAFHTALMESACAPLAAALQAAPMQPPRFPVVSNVDARPHTDPEELRQLLVQQVVRPVLWEDSVRWLIDQGAGSFYEIGPGKVLKGLLKRIDRKLECTSVGEA